MWTETLNSYPTINMRVFREDTHEMLYTGHNVICNTTKWLFARMMANTQPTDTVQPLPLGYEVAYGVWGLALGAGSDSWAPETQPQETPIQTALVSEFLRKPVSRINYVDTNFNPVKTLSLLVDFQTTVNATTDNITQGIREMGLIGGGTIKSTTCSASGVPPTVTTTDMLSKSYFSGLPSSTPALDEDTVILLNYKTLPPLLLPPGINIIFSWVLSF